METRHSVRSGADALVLAGIGIAVAAATVTVIHLTVGVMRFALFLAVG
jgi:hypothetical protein